MIFAGHRASLMASLIAYRGGCSLPHNSRLQRTWPANRLHRECVTICASRAAPLKRRSVSQPALLARGSRATIFGMTRIDKALEQILRGTSDSSVRFEDLRSLLLRLGFAERSRGS